MPQQYDFSIPTTDGQSTSFTLKVGETLFILGANGAGKSSLVARLFREKQENARRIAAHRQTWFESNTLDITAKARKDLENNTRAHDALSNARHREWNPAARAQSAIFDLIDADTTLERKIAALVRQRNLDGAVEEASSPSPIEALNEIMHLSNIPIAISLEEGQQVVARKDGSAPYSVAELSDGERNAFLIAANVLTAKPNTLLIIDEPERHLHRSIISPLLTRLFDKRPDCAFIVATHDIMLPLDAPAASALLVRSCEYTGQEAQSWSLDLVPSGAVQDDSLKQDLLGGRRKILFVEGTHQSLDLPLYSLLFPEVSIVPKASCRDVEHAVRGLRGATEMHWAHVWGVIDNDQRSPDDVGRLQQAGISALSHYSVESYYFHPSVIQRIAARNATVIGADVTAIVDAAVNQAIAAASTQKDHFVAGAVLRAVRRKVIEEMPDKDTIADNGQVSISIDVNQLRTEEEQRFDALIDTGDWDGLVARYPLRESQAFGKIVKALKIADVSTYQNAVLKLLQDDADALAEIRALMQGLYEEICAP